MISLAVTEILIKRVFFGAVQLRVLCTHQHLATSFWLQALDQSSGAAALSKPPEEDDLHIFLKPFLSKNFKKDKGLLPDDDNLHELKIQDFRIARAEASGTSNHIAYVRQSHSNSTFFMKFTK